MAIRERLYRDLTDLVSSQVSRILTYVGGMYIRDVREGYGRLSYEPVDKARQREAVRYVIGLAKDLDWLERKDLQTRFGIEDPLAERFRFNVFNGLFARLECVEACAQKSEDPYTSEAYMEDIYRTVWESTLKNRALQNFEMELQAAFLNSILEVSSAVAPAGSFKTGKDNAFAADVTGPLFLAEKCRDLFSHLKRGEPLKQADRFWLASRTEVSGYSPLSPIRTDQSAIPARYFDLLLRTRGLLKKAVAASNGETRLHYELLLYKIERAMDKK